MDPMGKNVPNMVKQLFLLGKASSLDGESFKRVMGQIKPHQTRIERNGVTKETALHMIPSSTYQQFKRVHRL